MKSRMAGFAAIVAVVWAVPCAVQAQGQYGVRVAATDGYVFTSEPGSITRPGTVYVYRPDSGGKWTEAARLTVPDARPGDRFGAALAADGTVLLASRVLENESRGVVHVFERRGNQWQHAGRITAGDAAANDSLGIAVALNNNVAAIAAGGRGGSVYVFRRSAEGRWTQEAKLTASDVVPGDRFGAAVTISGDRTLVGAPGQEKGRGAVYLFTRGANGQWGQQAKMVARTVTEGSALGAAVVLHGDYAIAGAPGRDESTGAVYLFEKNPQAEGWAAYTRLFPFDGSSQTRFGADLDIVGKELWVGGPGTDGSQGAVFRFAWDDQRSDWVAARKLVLPQGVPGGGFSSAVAIAGGTAIAGLPGFADGDGAVAVLARNTAGDWQQVARIDGEAEVFPAITGHNVRCAAGHAELFECGGMELLSFLPISDIGGEKGVSLNDIWGWTDSTTGREYALIGRTDGTSFVDVTDPVKPRYLGDLPMTQGARANAWRDIKVYRDHAYIVADGAGRHGVQVFDLTQLRDVSAPKKFTATALYENVFSAHNIVINEQAGVAYAVGSNSGGETCGGGLHMIDIKDPKKPKFAGCFADPQTGIARTGYSHDAQCVSYSGPDEKYRGREICFGSNETALSIADVTDKAKPVALSRASYPSVSYSHQGWLTPDQRFFYMNDEGDEIDGSVPRTRTIIWDVTDLDDPQVVGQFLGTNSASDHNLYIVGDTMYQSNYRSGLRVIDISDRRNPREVGYFDTVPNSDNTPGFQGSWSNYPYFKSGVVIFTSIREGFFVVRMQRPVS